MADSVYACDYSAQMGEQLFGTAPRAETWVLLEYPRPWAAKAYEESDIPLAVKAYIDSQTARMPHARVQLIAKTLRPAAADLVLYVIYAGWEAQRVRRFTLPGYEALLDLPLAAIANGDVDMGAPIGDPVYMVCTHGKRDVCCAKHGLPLYKALSKTGSEHVWQCNHIGGHRFAGTCVVFPHGIYYGRLTAPDIPLLAHSATQAEMLLPFIRGRACLDAPAQAAEYFLRSHLQQPGVNSFRWGGCTSHEGTWQVRFAAGDIQYQVTLAAETTQFGIMSNSGDTPGEPGTDYRLIEITWRRDGLERHGC